MDFLSVIATLLALFLIYNTIITLKKKENSAPEPSGALPLIGHLLLLDSRVPICRTLAEVADKLGPIFTIRLGTQQALVISNWESVKECFRTNDRVFLTRPRSAASKYLGYNHALFGLSAYGPYWHDIRKMAIHEVLSNTRLDLLKQVRISEIEIGVKKLYLQCTDKNDSIEVDMSKWFDNVTMNMMLKMIAGKRLEENSESRIFNKAIKKFMYLIGVFVISDVIPIPFLELLDLQGHVRSMKKTAMELDSFISKWVQEHIQNRELEKEEEPDFIDVMLSCLANQDSIYGHRKETVVKATALNLIIGGADTTSITLTWALSLVLNHPNVLKKAQEELDDNVGNERWVQESDFRNLPYIQAIIKETLRLYPSGPLSVPRESMEDCCIGGFHVPKGTILLVNLWKLHRDPRAWLNPCEFYPERFLDGRCQEFDVRGQHFEYIPFSIGRRSCPGISSGMQMSTLTLARVLQGFNLSTPNNEPVDMAEGLGATLPKAAPPQVKLTPRLPFNMY